MARLSSLLVRYSASREGRIEQPGLCSASLMMHRIFLKRSNGSCSSIFTGCVISYG